MTQARLLTARLELVPLADEHLPLEVELDSDPEVLRYLSSGASTPDEVAEKHRGRVARAGTVDGLGVWIGFTRDVSRDVTRDSPRDFVGMWMLQPPHGPSQVKVPGEAELGYRILRLHWRRGYAREGSLELIRYGFEELGLKRILAQTMTVNTPSRATMASVGMRYVRTFVEEFDDPLPGTEQGEVEYEIRRADWRGEPR
ncbi:MAG TPA: GNAT family N-acetyltransferase [Acidimicrobiia bacterium]|nr:GNAT family N-acetyltransferase [Acidimicrobiia bacterium]